jgi:hypothetical protein
MSASSSLPYRLRPNKAVDRELFLSLYCGLLLRSRLRDTATLGKADRSLKTPGSSTRDSESEK